jgi:N-hydroxyarylamine O-acetyltransferase
MPAIASSARQAEAQRALRARGLTVEDYLARLGLEKVPSSAEALAVLHARHMERVAYENLEIQLGWTTSIDFAESAQRIVRQGRGGYCFHLNGALGLLLEALGYTVERRRGTVQAGTPPDRTLNHLVLYVHDLPSDDHPEGTWWVDVGLGGDGFSRPLPLRAGRSEEGPYAYDLSASPVYQGGWQVRQEPAGSFVVADADTRAPRRAELDEAHARLSRSPDSGFVTTTTAQRRDATGVDILRACTLTRTETSGTRRTVIERETDWFAALREIFGIGLDDVPLAERRALWARVRAQHEAWLRDA